MTDLQWVLAIPLAVAALIFLCRALVFLPGFSGRYSRSGLGAFWGARLARLAGPLLRGSRMGQVSFGGYVLGVLLGFLPCGFLYAAVIAAGAGGSAASGAFAMAGFALGTAPTLLAVGWVGSLAVNRWRSIARAATAPAYLFGALTLGGMALRLIG